MPVVKAAGCYFAVVYAAGFILGAIRVLIVEPLIGETAAVLCETPFLLAAMALSAHWIIAKLNVSRSVSLIAMGLLALALQQIADVVLGFWLRGRSLADELAHFATPAGLIYAAALAAFAGIPLIVARTRRTNEP